MNGGNFNLGMASLADTGQWLLIVELSSTGISALLKNVDYEDTPAICLFNRDWEEKETELLSNIESAVYDNPRILEDFATHVIINTEKSLWIPTELTEDEEYDDSFFTQIYPAEAEDIGADFGEEEVCLYTLVEGLNAFIMRTLPGSRVSSHLSVLKGAFEKEEQKKIDIDVKSAPLQSIYVHIRQGAADIFAFSNGKLLCGAVHSWRDLTDVVYKALLVSHSYGLVHYDTTINLMYQDSGFKEENRKTQLLDYFSDFFREVVVLEAKTDTNMQHVSMISSLASGAGLKPVQINENN